MTPPTVRGGQGTARSEPDLLARAPRGATRTVVRFAALSVIGALLFVFHGLSLHLTPWSQAIINGIVKYGYGSAGQDATTVVLFREENLRALDESYPVSFERHAEVLEALSVYRPRAVFVDFAFVDRRRPEDVERLSGAICTLKHAGSDVYLAVPAPVASGERPSEVVPGLLACAAPASAQMDSEHGVSGVLTYGNGAATPTGFLPTPAFAMAAREVGLVPRDEQPMEIIWGNGVAPLNRKWMHCESEGAFSHLISVLRHEPMSVKLRCPYTRTISVAHLLGSTGDADVKDAIEQRAVFYGAAFQLTGDRVVSPVFEELPGVYLHAMAYDNLVTFRHDYKRAHRELVALAGRRLVIPLSGVVDALLLLATVGILLLVDEPALTSGLRRRLLPVNRSIRWIALGLAAVLVAAAVAVPALISPVFVSLPLLLAAFAFLHLAAPGEGPARATQGFVGRHIVSLGVAMAAVALFLVVDRNLGLEAALLLVVLPGYFLYKVLVARDVLFAATAALLVVSSLVSFLPPINLGPRNVIAYVAFFEVARHLIARADEAAAEYVTLRRAHPAAREWGVNARLLRVLDWLFMLCARTAHEEDRHADAAIPAG